MEPYREIVEGCIRGERSSQELLYKKVSGILYAICLRYAKNKMEAQDVLQEVFVKIYNNLNSYHFDGSFEGWARKIAVNTSITHYRKALKTQFQLDVDEVSGGIKDDQMPWANEYSMEEMLGCINRLPVGYKTIFNLYVIEGYKHKEIAAMLEIDVNTSKSQLSRAKSNLQKELEKLSNATFINHE